MTNFVDVEIEAEALRLFGDVLLDLLGKVFNGQPIILTVGIHDVRLGGSRDFAIGLIDLLRHSCDSLAAPFPGISGGCLERFAELLQMSVFIQTAFKICDPGLLAVITTMLVEHFDKHGDKSVDLLLGDHIGFLVDVEQNALTLDRDGLFQQTAKDGVFCQVALFEELGHDVAAVDRSLFQQQGEHLQ